MAINLHDVHEGGDDDVEHGVDDDGYMYLVLDDL